MLHVYNERTFSSAHRTLTNTILWMVISGDWITSADKPIKRKAMRQVRQDPLGKEVNPQPAASDEHSAQSSRGRLFRNNLILPTMVPLSSHRLNQWGQLREILGGVRHPECAAKHSSIDRPRPGK